jgi:hypothetical protein
MFYRQQNAVTDLLHRAVSLVGGGGGLRGRAGTMYLNGSRQTGAGCPVLTLTVATDTERKRYVDLEMLKELPGPGFLLIRLAF